MTFDEAIVPVCLQMFCEGTIVLDLRSEWGFKYNKSNYTTVEAASRNMSGSKNVKYDNVFPECRKAAEICRVIENSPLYKALS